MLFRKVAVFRRMLPPASSYLARGVMRGLASGSASALRVKREGITRRADALPLAENISFEAAWGLFHADSGEFIGHSRHVRSGQFTARIRVANQQSEVGESIDPARYSATKLRDLGERFVIKDSVSSA